MNYMKLLIALIQMGSLHFIWHQVKAMHL